ncbi:MAG: protein-disulfide isomerase [Actinobacteria bacterium]|nr:protein-disulfide isomerase [Actinomycetota bacterium]
MPRSIAVTFDYRCPFAYNGNAATIAAVRGGADLDVRYVAFSLDQVHVAEGEAPVWEREPEQRGSGVRALLFGIAVRDHFPDRFLDAHLELFAARHVHGGKLADPEVLRDAVARAGLDADEVERIAARPETLAALAREHTEMVDGHGVFGVPTFIEGDEAVFVRFMERGNVADLLRTLDLLQWPDLNEFKRTRIPR